MAAIANWEIPQVVNAPAGKYSLVVTDFTGKKIQHSTIEISNAFFNQNISLSAIASGVIIVNLVNDRGETVYTSQFVKN